MLGMKRFRGCAVTVFGRLLFSAFCLAAWLAIQPAAAAMPRQAPAPPPTLAVEAGYNGYIKVTNTNNPIDCHIIHITLATPYKPYSFLLDVLQALMERFPHAFPMLRLLLNH